jgi:hypothetical protein
MPTSIKICHHVLKLIVEATSSESDLIVSSNQELLDTQRWIYIPIAIKFSII